jgi:hypothetical protein
MYRYCLFMVMGMFAVVATAAPDANQKKVALKPADHQYQVLSPWAEADPLPLKGINPRIDTLAGKKIGLFANYKRAADPIIQALLTKLKTTYPDARFSLYKSAEWNVTEAETRNRDKFKKWVDGVDAAVLAVGD